MAPMEKGEDALNITDIELGDMLKLPWRDSSLDWAEGNGQGMHLGDMLSTIFQGQEELLAKYHDIEERNGHLVVPNEMFGEVDDRQVQTRIKDLTFRMIEELCEATNCLKNRPHKSTFVATDREHFYEELADALHYFIELLITAGVGPEDLFKLYFRKLAVNQFRQRSEY